MTEISTGRHVDERVVFPNGTTEPNYTASEGLPSQVANPSRASWRTFAQALVAFLVVVNIAALVVAGFLADPSNGLAALIDPAVYGKIVAFVNGLVVVGSAGSKLVALLMANPIVNAFITKYLSFLAPIKPAK